MLLAQAAPPAARPRRRLPVDAYIRDRAGEVARAWNRLDATRTDALLSQLETGKINCIHLPCCVRLPPGACLWDNAAARARFTGSGERRFRERRLRTGLCDDGQRA